MANRENSGHLTHLIAPTFRHALRQDGKAQLVIPWHGCGKQAVIEMAIYHCSASVISRRYRSACAAAAYCAAEKITDERTGLTHDYTRKDGVMHSEILAPAGTPAWATIRREQERSSEIEAIRAAVIEGEASGEPRPFDAGAFKQRMLIPHG